MRPSLDAANCGAAVGFNPSLAWCVAPICCTVPALTSTANTPHGAGSTASRRLGLHPARTTSRPPGSTLPGQVMRAFTLRSGPGSPKSAGFNSSALAPSRTFAKPRQVFWLLERE